MLNPEMNLRMNDYLQQIIADSLQQF